MLNSKKEARNARQKSEKVIYRALKKNAPNARPSTLRRMARIMVGDAVSNLNG